MRRPSFAALCALSVSSVALAACLENPDTGTAKNALSGVAIDGYLAGSTVYADLNNNNQLDAPEPRARTDRDGYFSYNPEKDVNYCDSGPQKYCLALGPVRSTATIRAVGGIDMATGTQFDGEITAEVENDGNPESPAPASPLTALRDAIEANSDQSFANLASIDASKVNDDFWADGGKTDLIKYAIRAQKAVDLVATKFEDHYDLGDSDYYDLNSFVYAGLAEYWANASSASLKSVLEETGTNHDWLPTAEDKVRAALDVSSSKNRRVDSGLEKRVRAIAQAMDAAFTNAAANNDTKNKAAAKSAATVAKIAADPDSDTSNLVSKLKETADDIATEIESQESSGEKEVDVASLANDLAQEQKNGTLNASSVQTATQNNAVTLRFPEVAGTEFNARNTDGGVTKVFAAFLQGSSSQSGQFIESEVQDGDLTVCRAKYDGELLDETPNRLTGTWERLTDRLLVTDLGIGGVQKTSNIRITAGNTVFSGLGSSDLSDAISSDKPGHIDWHYSVTVGGDETEGKISDNYTPPGNWKLFEARGSTALPGSGEACRCLLDARFGPNGKYERSGDDCSQFSYGN